MNAIELSIFASRINAICDEMGAVLQRAALSPNIKDRRDFSCALFDTAGHLCAQAAHIPVHLGSMAYAMGDIVSKMDWRPGDTLIVNDPYLGGTHLPDVTLISPVFMSAPDEELIGFVVNRAHHADIGASSPGSMPISKTLEEEGIIIPPTWLMRRDRLDEHVMSTIMAGTRNEVQAYGDYAAQISANRCGVRRLQALVQGIGNDHYRLALQALNDYAERLARHSLAHIPDGYYRYADVMDDDGVNMQDRKSVV